MIIHEIFDILAWGVAALTAVIMNRIAPAAFPVPKRQAASYYASLIVGSALGAFGLGTANLWLSGQPGIGRSIEGALFGAIVGVEIYKAIAGIHERTGERFVLPLALGIAVGRVGCFLAGMDDFTYGVPTSLPWGHDFGDGIPRHPVQLYEALAMLAFAATYVVALKRDRTWPATIGFPTVVIFYGGQRFIWEFLKPYGTLILGFSLFHLLSLALVAYGLFILKEPPHGDRTAELG